LETGLHHEPVHFSAKADDDAPKGLGAEINSPFPLHSPWIDVQPLQSTFRELLIGVVELVLEAGGEGDHGQVVGAGDGVDIAGEAEGKLGHGDKKGISSARGCSLDVEGGTRGGLADAAAHVLPPPGQALDEAQRGGGLSLTERRGRDSRDFDVLPIRPFF
jgi:hypothetical protein